MRSAGADVRRVKCGKILLRLSEGVTIRVWFRFMVRLRVRARVRVGRAIL